MTLQPALLSLYGRRGIGRARADVLRRARRCPAARRGDVERGFWARLARVDHAAARSVYLVAGRRRCSSRPPCRPSGSQLTPGSTSGIPRSRSRCRASTCCERAVGPGAVAPAQVARRHGPAGRRAPRRAQAAVRPARSRARARPGGRSVYTGRARASSTRRGRYAQVIVAGRHDYGFPQAQAFVAGCAASSSRRAGFPAGHARARGRRPAAGRRLPPPGVHATSRWLVARRARAHLPAAHARVPLAAPAAEGGAAEPALGRRELRDARRRLQWGVGQRLLGLYQFDQVEGWIPIFLFAMLFGLSMDYEVFLVTRMREAGTRAPTTRARSRTGSSAPAGSSRRPR